MLYGTGFIAAAAAVLFFFIPGLYSQSSASDHTSSLKEKMEVLNDSIEVLDARIHRIILGQDENIVLDSLKNAQQVLWESYEACRKELVSFLENRPEQGVSRLTSGLVRRIGWLYIMMGSVLLTLLVFLLFKKKQVKPPQSQKRPGKGLSAIPVTHSSGADGIEARFKRAVQKIAEISENEPAPPQKNKSRSAVIPEADSLSEHLSYQDSVVSLERPVISNNMPESTVDPDFTPRVPVSHLGNREFSVPDAADFFNPPVAPSTPFSLPADPISVLHEGPFPGRFGTEPLISEQSSSGALDKIQDTSRKVLTMARKGSTSSEISKRLKISQDEVELVLRTNREMS